jgi:hypothetical protein
MPNYWLNESETDFNIFFSKVTAAFKQIPHEQFLFVWMTRLN